MKKRDMIRRFVKRNPNATFAASPFKNKVSETYFSVVRKQTLNKLTENHMSAPKLTEEQRDEIYRLNTQEGVSRGKLADQFGVSVGNVVGLVKVRKKRAAQNNQKKVSVIQMIRDAKSRPIVSAQEQVESVPKPFDDLKTLETLEAIVDRVIDIAGKNPELIRLRREIGGMILGRENLSK